MKSLIFVAVALLSVASTVAVDTEHCSVSVRAVLSDGSPLPAVVGFTVVDGRMTVADQVSDKNGVLTLPHVTRDGECTAVLRYANFILVAEPQVISCDIEQPVEVVFEEPDSESLITVISQPTVFVGRVVRVVGRLRYDRYHTELYFDSESLKNRIEVNAVELLIDHPHQEDAARKLDGRLAVVYGRFEGEYKFFSTSGKHNHYGGRLRVLEIEKHRVSEW